LTPGRVYRHPEWKRLYDFLEPLLAEGMMLTYDSIAEWMGLDPRTARGRTQFLRCKKEILVRLDLLCQNIRKEGYRVIQPNEHVTASRGQLDRGRRRIQEGVRILAHTRLGGLTAQQARIHADALVRTSRILNYVTVERRPIRKLEQGRLPSPI